MIRSTALLVVELVVLFIGVSFLVEIGQRRVGADRLRAWMGGRPLVAALKGIIVGFATPFCTYSAIPLLIGLRQAGVPPAGYVAFICAAPVLDPILFGALILIVGAKVAIAYMVISFLAALGIGLLAEKTHLDRHLRPLDILTCAPIGGASSAFWSGEPGLSAACEGSSPTLPSWRGWPAERRRALHASTRLLRSFGPLLLLGVGIGILIESVVSPTTAAQLTTGDPGLAITTAAALGTPLYFNTELFVPIANSLAKAGVGVGAIVALTISGAGANLPEFAVLSRMARPRVISLFFV